MSLMEKAKAWDEYRSLAHSMYLLKINTIHMKIKEAPQNRLQYQLIYFIPPLLRLMLPSNGHKVCSPKSISLNKEHCFMTNAPFLVPI